KKARPIPPGTAYCLLPTAYRLLHRGLETAVDIATVADVHDHDHQASVLDLVDDSIIPTPDPVQVAHALEFLHAGRSGHFDQVPDLGVDSSLIGPRERREAPFRGAGQDDLIALRIAPWSSVAPASASAHR